MPSSLGNVVQDVSRIVFYKEAVLCRMPSCECIRSCEYFMYMQDLGEWFEFESVYA